MRTSGTLVLIKGAGDLASGIAVRLSRAAFRIVMTEIPCPTTVRRTVAFSRAVTEQSAQVEELHAELAANPAAIGAITQKGFAAVIVDRAASCAALLKPAIIVDAIIAKHNTGTSMHDAPIVIGVGPGFTAGEDCHAVVETQRGHTLGRVYYADSPDKTALPNTGIPGNIAGYTSERILRAGAEGTWVPLRQIGDPVEAQDHIASIITSAGASLHVHAALTGILRGMLPDGFKVHQGMKCGDIDPRCEAGHCHAVSDKALAIAGGVLEAILHCA